MPRTEEELFKICKEFVELERKTEFFLKDDLNKIVGDNDRLKIVAMHAILKRIKNRVEVLIEDYHVADPEELDKDIDSQLPENEVPTRMRNKSWYLKIKKFIKKR